MPTRQVLPLRHTSNQYVLLWHEDFPVQDSQASDIHCLAEAERGLLAAPLPHHLM